MARFRDERRGAVKAAENGPETAVLVAELLFASCLKSRYNEAPPAVLPVFPPHVVPSFGTDQNAQYLLRFSGSSNRSSACRC